MINSRATSKTQAQENLDPKKPGPKNIDPEKHAINIGLKNMSAFKELIKKTSTNGVLTSKSKLDFSGYKLLYATIKWKS